jgi:hypothetical protein
VFLLTSPFYVSVVYDDYAYATFTVADAHASSSARARRLKAASQHLPSYAFGKDALPTIDASAARRSTFALDTIPAIVGYAGNAASTRNEKYENVLHHPSAPASAQRASMTSAQPSTTSDVHRRSPHIA